MKLNIKLILGLFFILTFSSTQLLAKEKRHHSRRKNNSAVKKLSPQLRELLQKEMQSLQEGMQSIIPAYVSGNWKKIEDIAYKMEHSYILKQRLTQKQKKEIHTKLPHSFIKQDKHFHYLAGMLNHVAKKKNVELVGFYFSKLNESCVSCHTQFAKHRFPAFSAKKKYKH